MRTRVIIAAALALLIVPALVAQSPNTGTIIVIVVDQTGAVLPDAKISITNSATGATRDAISSSDGRATIPALPLTGTYSVHVSKQGFGDEERNKITLR